MKKIIIAALAFLFAVLPARAVAPLSLKACEEAALQNSKEIKAAESAAQAAQAAYKSAESSLYPTLNLEAGGSYVSEIPSITFGGETFEFGSKWGYSVGPVLYYTLFDYGARNDQRNAALKIYESKQQDLEWNKKSVLLSVRLAYFKVRQDLETMFLLSQQLEVADKQFADVKSAFNAGAKSELDVAMANKQVLSVLSQISAARALTASDLRDLFEITLDDFSINPAYPLDSRIKNAGAAAPASAVIKADDVDAALEYFKVYNHFAFDAESPQLLSAEKMVEYYTKLSGSYKAALWPNVGLKAGYYWEYPNGPIREKVWLGQASLGLSMPLFEAGRTRSLAKQQKANAQSAAAQKELIYVNLKKTFDAAKDRLYSIGIEVNLAEKMIEDGRKTSELTYQAYKAGAVTFLEVDTANFTLTESKINLADLKIENLTRLAVIASLGK